MNMLSRAIEAHAKALKRAAGVAVTYRQGSHESESITATPTSSTYIVEDEATGIPQKVTSQDWIFTAADLIVAGQTIEPKPGDQITRASDGETFIVTPIAGRRCFEPHGEYGLMVVIHTKNADQ